MTMTDSRHAERTSYIFFAVVLLIILAFAAGNKAHATPCTGSTNDKHSVCSATTGSNSPAQGQTATGTGIGTGGTSSATTGPVASRSNAEAHSTAGSDVSVVSQGSTYREAANVPGLGIIAPNGCGAGVQGGGSSRGGAAVAGIAWTTDECYQFILAQSYQALGEREAACEILGTTKAAQRAIKRGARLPVCAQPPVSPTVVVQTGYTQAQVDLIVKKMMRK